MCYFQNDPDKYCPTHFFLFFLTYFFYNRVESTMMYNTGSNNLSIKCICNLCVCNKLHLTPSSSIPSFKIKLHNLFAEHPSCHTASWTQSICLCRHAMYTEQFICMSTSVLWCKNGIYCEGSNYKQSKLSAGLCSNRSIGL